MPLQPHFLSLFRAPSPPSRTLLPPHAPCSMTEVAPTAVVTTEVSTLLHVAPLTCVLSQTVVVQLFCWQQNQLMEAPLQEVRLTETYCIHWEAGRNEARYGRRRMCSVRGREAASLVSGTRVSAATTEAAARGAQSFKPTPRTCAPETTSTSHDLHSRCRLCRGRWP